MFRYGIFFAGNVLRDIFQMKLLPVSGVDHNTIQRESPPQDSGVHISNYFFYDKILPLCRSSKQRKYNEMNCSFTQIFYNYKIKRTLIIDKIKK